MITEPMRSDDALTDLERCLAALIPDAHARESVLAAAEMYGDCRADEALTSLPRA